MGKEQQPKTEPKPSETVELMTVKKQMSREEIKKNLIAYLEKQGLKVKP